MAMWSYCIWMELSQRVPTVVLVKIQAEESNIQFWCNASDAGSQVHTVAEAKSVNAGSTTL